MGLMDAFGLEPTHDLFF